MDRAFFYGNRRSLAGVSDTDLQPSELTESGGNSAGRVIQLNSKQF